MHFYTRTAVLESFASPEASGGCVQCVEHAVVELNWSQWSDVHLFLTYLLLSDNQRNKLLCFGEVSICRFVLFFVV